MSNFVTDVGSLGLQDGSITWSSATIKARLVASSVTPTVGMTSMTGMTAIGTDQTLGSKTGPTTDGTNHRTVYDAADPTYTAVAGGSTVGWVVIYKFITNDAGSIPIAVLDVANTATNGGDITVPFDSAGIFYTQQ